MEDADQVRGDVARFVGHLLAVVSDGDQELVKGHGGVDCYCSGEIDSAFETWESRKCDIGKNIWIDRLML